LTRVTCISGRNFANGVLPDVVGRFVKDFPAFSITQASRFVGQCNFVKEHTKIMAFSAPILTKLINDQHPFLEVPFYGISAKLDNKYGK
jgi:hypothetical protein